MIGVVIISKLEYKPRRIRIYKLSTFDAFTQRERDFNNAYNNATAKNKAFLKQVRDEEIAKFEGIRKIESDKLYTYEYDENGNIKQKHENTNKQIALFESEMARYATDFSVKNPLLMEIVYLKIANQNMILKQIIDRGLDIDNKHYIVYTSTTNQMKRGEIILINEEFNSAHKTDFMCGLTDDIINEKGGCNTGKYLAYKGLPMSTSFIPDGYEIDIDKCLVVKDFETFVNEKVECIDHDDTEITNIETRNENIKIPQTDGAGMFLPGVLPATAQIRCGHIKGCVFPFDFRKFLEQEEVEGIKPSPIIFDVWDKPHNVIEEDIQIILTDSQVKLRKYYDSWDEFKKKFKYSKKQIAINKFADLEPRGYSKSSYQFIQTLSTEKLTDEMIENICADTIAYLDSLKEDADKIVEILGEGYLTDCIKVYPQLIQDKYVQCKLENKFQSERNEARGNKLILKDSLYSYICPDLYAFCEWLFCGIENPKGIIPKDYVYNSFFNDKDYDVVDCLRSPHLYMEHGIRKLVKDKDLELCQEWFAYSEYDTIVSSHDLLCRVLMFDVDGDEVLLTPNEYIIASVPEDKNILYYESFETDKSEVSGATIYKALVASMDNSNIGDISNIMTKNYNNDTVDDDFNKVMCCYNNLTIDFPKSQKNISLGKYENQYNKLKAEKAPYFFRYAKGKSKNNCKELSNSNCDRICKYIDKKTNGKKYKWKSEEEFNPSILMNHDIKVNRNDKKYEQLNNLMFELKKRECSIEKCIEKELQQLNKSDSWQEKISKYVIFYDMCEKMILNVFKGDRAVAAEYLIDSIYLERDNDNAGKNILWELFGDVLYENICNNKNLPSLPQKRKHYSTSNTAKIRTIELNTIKRYEDKINEEISIYKEELEWINSIPYRKGCTLDRDLLFILMVQFKRNGKVWVHNNKKNELTCGRLDKWLGEGVCVAKKGIERLEKLKVISVTKHKQAVEISLNIPKSENLKEAYKIYSKELNPIFSFYEHNGERKVEKCLICGNKFFKYGNQKTCPNSKCSKELELKRKRIKVS